MSEIHQTPSFEISANHEGRLEREVLKLFSDNSNLTSLLQEIKSEADKGTYIHSLETAYVAHRLAIELGVPEHDSLLVACGAGLHDIAKKDQDIKAVITIPNRLNPQQHSLAAEHPSRGQQYVWDYILNGNATSQHLDDVVTITTIIGYHHSVDDVEDPRLRNLVELVHIVDRGLALSDINRPYLRARDGVLTVDTAFLKVQNEEVKAGRATKKYFGRSITELCKQAAILATEARRVA